MSDDFMKPYTVPKAPVLRLRPSSENEGRKQERANILQYLDGPWTRHPGEIKESVYSLSDAKFPLDIDLETYRKLHKERLTAFIEFMRQIPLSERQKHIKIEHVSCVPSLVDKEEMEHTLETNSCKEDIEELVEHTFVNCNMYLEPGEAYRPCQLERFGRDWSWNARGVYYRHYYSPHWVTADYDLWIPTIDNSLFDDPTEEHRRARANDFLRHALDNERWNKSEYSWEAYDLV